MNNEIEFELDAKDLERKTKYKNKVYQVPNCQLEEFMHKIDYPRLCLEALCSQLPPSKQKAFKKKAKAQTGIKLFPQFYCIES